jgi:hypothetical protein
MASPYSSPWLYFGAGALLPTIAFVLTQNRTKEAQRRKTEDDSDSEDEDLHGVETTGQSSQWDMMDGPYKVSCIPSDFSFSHFEFLSITL